MKAPFVKVTWDDAEDPPTDGRAWLDVADVDAWKDHRCTVVSVGYLVAKTKRHITLAADWIDAYKQFGRVTKIPRGMVISVQKLKA